MDNNHTTFKKQKQSTSVAADCFGNMLRIYDQLRSGRLIPALNKKFLKSTARLQYDDELEKNY